MRAILLTIAVFTLFATHIQAQQIRIASALLTSGNGSNYNNGEGIRIIQGIDADVVLIQQFVYTSGSYQDFTTITLGSGSEFYRGSGQIPTGILSRYPIVLSGEWVDPNTPNRTFSWAKIDIPGEKFLWAVSIHLTTVSASNRNSSATSLISQIQANIPASDYLVVGGSFNCDTRSEPLFATLSAVVTIPANFPVDQAGNSNTNSNRNRPYDNLLFDADLQLLAAPTAAGANSFPAGLVLDTRLYTPLADFAPALLSDSIATDRMAVLRDVSLGGSPIRVTNSSFSFTPSPSGQITFTSQPGLTYWVQASSTLAAGSWQGIGGITAPIGSSTSFQIVPANPAPGQVADPQLGAAPKRFYRIYH